MSVLSKFLTLGVLLASGLGARATAQNEGVRRLSLDAALKLARERSRDLRAAREKVRQAETGIEQARASLLPTLSAQGKYTHNYKEVDLNLAQFNSGVLGLSGAIQQSTSDGAEKSALAAYDQQLISSTPGAIVIQPKEQLDGSLNATVPLIVPSAYPAYSAAKRTTEAAEATREASEATILLQVAQGFFTLAGAEELLLARRHAIEVAKRTAEDAKARFESGTVNRVEVQRAELALLRAEQAEVEAADAQSQAYRALATLLDLREPFRVVPEAVPLEQTKSTEEQIQQAAQRRPEFAALERSVVAADAQADSAGWQWAPRLSAFGNAKAFNYPGFAGDRYSWAVGAQIDWTLFDGGARDAQRHLASAQRRESEARLALLRDSLGDEIANGERSVETKRRALDTAEHSVALSRDTLELVRAQYDAGTATQIDLLQAQDSLVAAEVSLAQAHFDLSLADLTLRRSLGLFPKKE